MIHKEGYATLAIVYGFVFIVEFLIFYFSKNHYLKMGSLPVALFLLFFFTFFFRNPTREFVYNAKDIMSPADGTVVTIEQTNEPEYLKNKCIQVSIFMSAWNMHKNLVPMDGIVSYYKYHPGKYFLAKNPKSSTLNERTSIGIKNEKNEILVRQIAGFVARRIVCYMKEGMQVKQNQELGFIKFGSRVDLFLPLDAKIKVKLGQKVHFGQTEIAEFSK